MQVHDRDSTPRDLSEADLKLQQVFSEATRLFRSAIVEESTRRGFLQRFTPDETIPVPTIAFRLNQRYPVYIEGVPSIESWIIFVPETEGGEKSLNLFWLKKAVHVQGALSDNEGTTHQFYRRGSLLVLDQGEQVILTEEADAVIADSTDEVDLVAISEEASRTELELREGFLRGVDTDFELVPFLTRG
ncbi:MAG: hypothetical protein AAB624_02355 [Patescibacteria group bacterium]